MHFSTFNTKALIGRACIREPLPTACSPQPSFRIQRSCFCQIRSLSHATCPYDGTQQMKAQHVNKTICTCAPLKGSTDFRILLAVPGLVMRIGVFFCNLEAKLRRLLSDESGESTLVLICFQLNSLYPVFTVTYHVLICLLDCG